MSLYLHLKTLLKTKQHQWKDYRCQYDMGYQYKIIYRSDYTGTTIRSFDPG